MNVFASDMMAGYTHQCRLLTPTIIPDGQGGSKNAGWVEGVEFPAAFSNDTTTETLIAEQQGFKSTYHIAVKKSMQLKYHDVIVRLSDGKVFRVTKDGDDDYTPPTASFDVRHLVLERWELPNDD